MGKEVFSTDVAWPGYPRAGKWSWASSFCHTQKLTLKWTTDLNTGKLLNWYKKKPSESSWPSLFLRYCNKSTNDEKKTVLHQNFCVANDAIRKVKKTHRMGRNICKSSSS